MADDLQQHNPQPEADRIKALLVEAELAVKTINQRLADANAKSEALDAALAKLGELQETLASANANKAKIQEDAERLKAEVDRLIEEGRNLLASIKETAASVEQKVTAIQDFYPNFQNLKASIENSDNGLQAILNQSSKTKTEVEQIKVKADNYLIDLEKSFNLAQQKNQEIENFFSTKFEPLRARVLDPENGIAIILKRLESAQTSSKNREEKIRDYASLSEQNTKNTENILQTAESTLDSIESSHKASESYREKIREITELVTATGLANAFNKRKKELYWGVIIWGSALLGSGLLLARLFYVYFVDQDRPPPSSIVEVAHRVVLFAPLVFLVGFSSRQYSKERNLLEEYSFKTAISSSFNAYTQLLTENFTDARFKDDILNFALQSIEAIYKHPSLPTEIDQEAEVAATGMGAFRWRNKLKPLIGGKIRIKKAKKNDGSKNLASGTSTSDPQATPKA